MYALMVEQFYGDPEKRIKGAVNQLIGRDNAFGFLYNRDEGVNGIERTLKPMCCGNSTSTNYIAGVHFNAKMIGTKSHKKLSGLRVIPQASTFHTPISLFRSTPLSVL